MSILELKTKVNSILLSVLGFEFIDPILANEFTGKQNVYLQALDGSNHFSGTKAQWVDFIDQICHLNEAYFDDMSQETVLESLSMVGITSGYYEYVPDSSIIPLDFGGITLIAFPATTLLNARIAAEYELRNRRFEWTSK